MSETPSNDQPSPEFNKLDLSQLQDFSFGTQWSQDKSPGPASRDERPRREDRPRREGPGGPSDGKRDRRGFRKPVGAPGSTDAPREGNPSERPRREGPGGPGPRRDDRPRREGPGGDRPRFGGSREREIPVGPYISPYFNVTFYPEDAGFAALAKAVRSSCRTYELFEIARVVIGKHDRFIAVVQPKTPDAPRSEGSASVRPAPFAISVPDGLPFENEEAAINHVLSTHLDKFFEVAEVEVEPPSGNFQVVNRCAFSGELLGPPNYHLYNQIVAQHHQSTGIRLPLDVYRSTKIESVRDPEAIAQWLEKMKKGVLYTLKTSAPAPATAAESEAKAETEAAPAPASEGEKTSPELASTAEDVAATADTVEAPPESTEAPAAEVAEEVAAPATTEAPSFNTLEAARTYLLSNARARVVRTVETLRLSGRLLETLAAGEIRRAIEGQLERQQKFPLDTANALRGRLRREGFTIFKKGSKGISYVCAVKRKFRTPGQVFADSIGALIGFIETHPMVRQSELPTKHLGITAPVATTEGEAAPALSPEDQARLGKLNMDLRWLVGEGYVTEFIDGRLFAPPTVVESSKRDSGAEEHDPENFPEAPADESPVSKSVTASPQPVAPAATAEPTAEPVATEESPVMDETAAAEEQKPDAASS